MNHSLSIALALSLLRLTSTICFAADSDLAGADKSFIQEAYEAGLAETAAGQMGLAKSAQPDVKAFAQQMVDDHSMANAELKTLADSKKVTVATEPPMMSKAKAKMLDMKSGAEFDKEFAAAMVSDHQTVVQNFEKASNDAKDADVKAFATKMLPHLKEHLSKAEALQAKVGK